MLYCLQYFSALFRRNTASDEIGEINEIKTPKSKNKVTDRSSFDQLLKTRKVCFDADGSSLFFNFADNPWPTGMF